MWYGRTGSYLEIDLSQGRIEKEEVDPKLHEAFLGGRGTATKLLWDRVAPETEPFSPSNLLIFDTGVFTGTLVPGSNRGSIVTRSPQTNLLTYSVFGGFWPAELKRAGYDGIIISGRSPTPVYLWISDDNIEIRDASYLWGRDTIETRRMIREELKKEKIEIASIGPAGENRVFGASVEFGEGVSASRSGVGAIMGDKNLKAIAVCGTKDINIAKPSESFELWKQILGRADRYYQHQENYWKGPGGYLLSVVVRGNLGGEECKTLRETLDLKNTVKLGADFAERSKVRSTGCYNCPVGCVSRVLLADGGYVHVKCQGWFEFLGACGIMDFDFSMKCINLCERYGLDQVSTAHLISFAIDLYEKGILTKEDTEGIHLEGGNKDLVFSLIEKIVRREGIGAVLANGVYEASRQIGKGAEAYAHHVKKLELTPWRLYVPFHALLTAVTDRADLTRGEDMIYGGELMRGPREAKEEYIKEGWFHYPKEFQEDFLTDYDPTGSDHERIARFVWYNRHLYCLADMTGICMYWMGFFPYPPIHLDTIVNLISSVTGMSIDETEVIKMAERVTTLTRAYNVILGIRRKDDRIPEKFFKVTPQPPLMRWDPDKFTKTIDEYYKLCGWNSEGIPTKEELDKVGLGYVRQEFERRGIL